MCALTSWATCGSGLSKKKNMDKTEAGVVENVKLDYDTLQNNTRKSKELEVNK